MVNKRSSARSPSSGVATQGERLRAARLARGLSQVDIADACDVSRNAVSLWEKNDAKPRPDSLEKTAARLRVELEWLRTGCGKVPDLTPVERSKRRLMTIQTAADIIAHDTRMLIPADSPEEMPSGSIVEMVSGIGSGPLAEPNDRVHDWWRVPPAVVAEVLRSRPENIRIFRVMADSMEPVIRRGDYVLIDISQVRIVADAVVAIDNGIGCVLKRIRIVSNNGSGVKAVLHSDGDSGEDQDVPIHDEARIVGRCVAHFRVM